MLARLVVHLNANYASLQTGLTQTAMRANDWQSGMASAAAAANVLDQTATQLAFTATTTANALSQLSHMTTASGQAFSALDKSTAVATSGLQTALAVSGTATPVLMRLSGTASGVAANLNMIAGGARTAGSYLSLGSKMAGGFARAIGLVSTWISAAVRMVELLIAGLKVLLIPLRIVGSAGVMAFHGLGVAVSAVLLPFRLLWGTMVAVASGIWAVVRPLLSMAMSIAKVWFLLKGWLASWKMIFHWLSLMPPKIRILVGGLLALGIAGKAGGAALSVLAGAARMAATGVKVLLLPIQLIRNPTAAAVTALNLLGGAMLRMASIARSGVSAVAGFTRSVASMAAGAVSSAAGAVNRLGGSILTTVAKGAALTVMAGLGWGVSLANEAEQAQVAFTTMLGSADAAKSTLASLERFSASTPFDLPSVRDGARSLLAAKVSTQQLEQRLTMLGDIAAGTSRPLEEFVDIFTKVKNKGVAGLEDINRLAEKGVPIYDALQQTLGVSRDEMMKMISDGKVGFAQFDAALQSTTSAGGMFAGGMVAQSQTITGLFSTLKDYVGMTFQSLAQTLMNAFDFKGLMQRGITFAENTKNWMISITPIIQSVAAVVSAAFSMMWDIASSVWSAIADSAGVTGGQMAELIVTALAMAEFGFTNWRDVATLAMLQIGVGFLAFIGGFTHFFTTSLPAYLSYFASNFTSVFLNAFDYVTTIFINLGQNIRNIMSEIWDFIASGGTNSLELAWTPLTDGFVNTLKAMEEIPAREIGPLEASMQQQIDSLSGTLNQGMEGLVAERLKALDDFNAQAPPQLPDITAQTDQPTEDGVGAGENKDNKPSPLAKGSADAFSAIFAAMRANENAQAAKLQQQTALAATRTAVATEQMANKLNNTKQLAMIEEF